LIFYILKILGGITSNNFHRKVEMKIHHRKVRKAEFSYRAAP